MAVNTDSCKCYCHKLGYGYMGTPSICCKCVHNSINSFKENSCILCQYPEEKITSPLPIDTIEELENLHVCIERCFEKLETLEWYVLNRLCLLEEHIFKNLDGKRD